MLLRTNPPPAGFIPPCLAIRRRATSLPADISKFEGARANCESWRAI